MINVVAVEFNPIYDNSLTIQKNFHLKNIESMYNLESFNTKVETKIFSFYDKLIDVNIIKKNSSLEVKQTGKIEKAIQPCIAKFGHLSKKRKNIMNFFKNNDFNFNQDNNSETENSESDVLENGLLRMNNESDLDDGDDPEFCNINCKRCAVPVLYRKNLSSKSKPDIEKELQNHGHQIFNNILHKKNLPEKKEELSQHYNTYHKIC